MVKVERTFPAPTSLAVEAQKASGKYDEPDVIRQLREGDEKESYFKGSSKKIVESITEAGVCICSF